jgi:sugar/nucleoside kinase (ribokinase family)
MSDLVIVGTIGLDDIKTPFGEEKSIIGGSGSYSACAASYFTKPALVSVIGKDLPNEYLDFLKKRNIDLSGIEIMDKTFRWSGQYEFDMNEAQTLKTELNSLALFNPILSEKSRQPKFLLLANVDPIIQLSVLSQMKSQPFVALDSMNYWIQNKKEELIELIAKVDLLVLNEGEARQFLKMPNLIRIGRELLNMGPEYVIIKKGEHGAMLFSQSGFFSAPGYPLEEVKDPTGAGDSFIGGLMGYLANLGEVNDENIRKAVIYGSIIASFCAESFGLEYCKNVRLKEIEERYNVFTKIREF